MERRLHERRPVKQPQTLTMSIFPNEKQDNICITADVIDRGPGGFGIECDCVLEMGIVVMRNDQGELIKGVLAWIEDRGGGSCRAGIKLDSNFNNPSRSSRREAGQPFTLPEFQHHGYFTSILVDVVEPAEKI